MRIICKWVFKDRQYMKAKQKDISGETADEVMNMITTLLAQSETIRLIFEKEEKKND